MDKNHKVANEIIKEIEIAAKCAMAYQENKDKLFYQTGRKAIKNLLMKHSDVLEGLDCDNPYWIAFSFAAATLK